MTDEEVNELIANTYCDVSSYYGDREGGYSKNRMLEAINKVREKYQTQLDDLHDEMRREVAGRDAKIFAYEAIISNSNFKMAVVRKTKGKEECE